MTSERAEKGKKQETTRWKVCSNVKVQVGRDSVVGIATSFELDRSGIEPQWGRDFSHPFRPASRPTQTLVQRVTYLFPGRKADGAWRGVALTTHTYLTPVLKKEYSYTSIPPPGLHGLLWGRNLVLPRYSAWFTIGFESLLHCLQAGPTLCTYVYSQAKFRYVSWGPPPSSSGKTTPQNKKQRCLTVSVVPCTHHYISGPLSNTELFTPHLPRKHQYVK